MDEIEQLPRPQIRGIQENLSFKQTLTFKFTKNIFFQYKLFLAHNFFNENIQKTVLKSSHSYSKSLFRRNAFDQTITKR